MQSPDLALIFHQIWHMTCAKWKKKRLFWGLDRHFQWHHEVTQMFEKCGKVQIYIWVNKLPPWLYKVRITSFLVSRIRWSSGLRHLPDDVSRLSTVGSSTALGGGNARPMLIFWGNFHKKKFFLKNLLVFSPCSLLFYLLQWNTKKTTRLYLYSLIWNDSSNLF